MKKYSYNRPATAFELTAPNQEGGIIPPEHQETPNPHDSEAPAESHSSRFRFDTEVISAEGLTYSEN